MDLENVISPQPSCHAQRSSAPRHYPALLELSVPERELQFFLELLAVLYREQICIPPSASATVNGFQTPNLLQLTHPAVTHHLELIRVRVAEQLPVACKLCWAHLIDYAPGGYQAPHDHAKSEDYSAVLYLDSGSAGTIFCLNGPRNVCTTVPQEKGKLCVFLSQLTHEARAVETAKKVLVCGFRLES